MESDVTVTLLAIAGSAFAFVAFISVLYALMRETSVPREVPLEELKWQPPLLRALGFPPSLVSAQNEIAVDFDSVQVDVRSADGVDFHVASRCADRDLVVRAGATSGEGGSWESLDASARDLLLRFAARGGSVLNGRAEIPVRGIPPTTDAVREVRDVVRILSTARSPASAILRRVTSADDPGRVSIAAIAEDTGTLTDPGVASPGALSKKHPLTCVTRVWATSGAGEDRVLAIPVGDAIVLVVADGAGGTGGGAAAAEKILARTQHVAAALASGVYAPAELLAELDRTLAPTGAQAAATVVVVTATRVFGACAGDVDALYETAGMSYDLTRNRRRKPLLGSGEVEPVAFSQEGPGRLLVATDGLFGYAKREAIRETLATASTESAPDRLVELVRLRSGELPDDVGMAIVVP